MRIDRGRELSMFVKDKELQSQLMALCIDRTKPRENYWKEI